MGRVVLILGVQILVLLLPDVLPIRLADSKMLQYPFRTQKARSQRHRNNISFAQLAGHGEGQPYDGNLYQVVKNVTAVVKSIPIGNFENNSSPSTEHQRNGVVGSDDVGMDCLLQHAQAVIEVDCPECLAEFRQRVAAPHVIDQNVQSLVPPFDSGDQLFHLRRLGVINSSGNAAPAGGGDEFSGFFDG